ncbi:hypothetical protein [Streptomyces seoulensis]|uniref:hypothetical protein n=1 Tax=Streptomyces seoulensis TaxID=73044 RepID=UPI001FCAEDD3|nr:hypothetical protein [Streptomyces seoulensis]BDH04911.1 hypothetical protein HEK131_21380 [Streptomyces seoulensis]
MAQDSWPSPAHNARAITDTEYEKIAARFSGDGVYGTPDDTPVVTAGAGLTVDVRAGVYASVRGHAWTSGTSTVNLPVPANTSGSTRVDRVVLRLDRAAWTVRAVVKLGTPGSGAPTLTQDVGDTGVYEVPVGIVTTASAGNSVTVARGEQYVGTRIRACTSATRNPTPALGELCFETDTRRVRVWTGTAWNLVFDDSGQVVVTSSASGWKSSGDSVLQKRNGVVYLRTALFQRTGATLAGETESRLPITIPAAYVHPNRDQNLICYTTGLQVSRAVIYSAATDKPGQVWLVNHPSIEKDDYVIPGGSSWVVD